MKIYKFKYKFLVFLYAYLRCIDLSLDRSRWTTIDEVRKYLKNKHHPVIISNYLLKQSGLNIENSKLQYFINDDPSFVWKIKQALLRIFQKQAFLTKDEILYLCQKLLILESFLKANNDISKVEVETLRNDIAMYCYHVLEYKLTLGDRKKAMNIEHYLSNERVNVVFFEDFMKQINFKDLS